MIKTASGKLNITIIVRVHGKMRAALNQFSYDVMKKGVSEAPTKSFCIFRKNYNDLLFLRFFVVGILKVGPGAKVYNAFLFNTPLLGSPGYFLQLNTLC